MILHGQLDGIVPVEHSHHFLSSLVVEEVVEEVLSGDSGHENTVESKSTVTLRAAAVSQTLSSISTDMKSVASSATLTRESINGKVNESRSTFDRELFSAEKTGLLLSTNEAEKNKRPVLTNKNTRTSAQWTKREQDAIVTIPGAKHSFEAVGGEVVEIICEGVINWLSTAIVIK